MGSKQPVFTSIKAPNPDWQYNAWVDHRGDWDTYATGFKALADIGVDRALEGGPTDFTVYPIIFCYRQYLELRLKQLIVIAGKLLDQDVTRPNNHNLVQLWTMVRPLLEKVWKDADLKRELDSITRVVTAFAEVDPLSDAFRYPVDKTGNASLSDMETINVKHLRKVIDKVAPTLNGASYGIEHDLEIEAEMRAEYMQDAL